MNLATSTFIPLKVLTVHKLLRKLTASVYYVDWVITDFYIVESEGILFPRFSFVNILVRMLTFDQ
jgi:hypothetical protein